VTPETRSSDVAFVPPVTATYVQSPQERRALRGPLAKPVPWWLLAIIGATNAANILILLADHHWSFWTVVQMSGLVMAAIVIAFAMTIAAIKRKTNFITGGRAFDLTLAAEGMRGTIDRQPCSLPWSSIRSARDTGPYILLCTERLDVYFAIPKSSLVNPHRVWADLQAILVAKRGLIVSDTARTYIVHSAA
jgi:hypothetical protein